MPKLSPTGKGCFLATRSLFRQTLRAYYIEIGNLKKPPDGAVGTLFILKCSCLLKGSLRPPDVIQEATAFFLISLHPTFFYKGNLRAVTWQQKLRTNIRSYFFGASKVKERVKFEL